MTTKALIKPRAILSLSTVEKRKLLDSFDYVFSDIDGVVWNVEHNVQGADEGFKALKNAGKKLEFITNNSVRPAKTYVERFDALNMGVNVDDIWHPAKSIAEYLKNIKFDGLIYIIATENFKNTLRKAGFKLIDGPNKIIPESYTELAKHIFDKEQVRAVVIDHDYNISTAKLIRAQVYLRHPDCLLICGATDMMMPVGKDNIIMGPGPFAKILAEAAKKEMITLGKPGKELAEILIKHYNIVSHSRALMIGDMLEQDIGMGKQCGFQTLVVLSGGCTFTELEAQTNPKYIPDYYAESMSQFVDFMDDIKKSNV